MGRPAPVPPAAATSFSSLGASFLTTVFSVNSQPEVADQPVGGLADVGIYFYGALWCFVVQWVIRLVVLKPLARAILPVKKESIIIKFAQAATEFYNYAFFCVGGIKVCYAQPWIWPSSQWWIGKLEGTHSLITPSFKFFYLLYGGRYLAQLVSVFIEPKRKDFAQMVIHHAATTVLILLSYSYGYVRVGAAVMLLLDPADPPLHAAKICKYMANNDNKSRWQFLADRWLEVFALSFFTTRCGMYPYIVWSAAFEAPRHIDHSKDPAAYLGIYLIDELFAIGLLAVLMVLQFFWGMILLKVVIKALQGGHAEDARSDDEDDDAAEEPPAARKKTN